MNADHVELAAGEMRRVLTPLEHADWTVRAGSLDWTCRETAAHIGHDLIAYAMQLTARATDDYLPVDLVVRPAATPAQTLQIAVAAATLLAAALRSTPAEARAWHWGPTDPSGFAALGVNEILAHTYDIATGLGRTWKPPAELSALVVTRLFPDAPATAVLPTTVPPTTGAMPTGAPASPGAAAPGEAAPPAADPGDVLLWCTGRKSLPGHPRRTSWHLRAARD